jgi:hypothetical protein
VRRGLTAATTSVSIAKCVFTCEIQRQKKLFYFFSWKKKMMDLYIYIYDSIVEKDCFHTAVSPSHSLSGIIRRNCFSLLRSKLRIALSSSESSHSTPFHVFVFAIQ